MSSLLHRVLLHFRFLCLLASPLWARKQNKQPSHHSLSHELGSEQSEQASEQVSAAEHTSKASSADQENRWSSGPVHQSVFLVVLAHSAPVSFAFSWTGLLTISHFPSPFRGINLWLQLRFFLAFFFFSLFSLSYFYFFFFFEGSHFLLTWASLHLFGVCQFVCS